MQRISKGTAEDNELIAVFDWLKLKGLRRISWHTANERKVSAAAGARLKRKGVLAGVSDIIVARSRHNYHGLFVELKIEPNKLTKPQIEFIDIMREEGYCCHIAWSAEEAIQQIADYLEIDSGLQ